MQAAGGSLYVNVHIQCAHIIPWVVLVVVRNDCGSEPAADEKDDGECS
jgi:hypothetical protein